MDRLRAVGYTRDVSATRTRYGKVPISRKSKLILALTVNQLLSSGTHLFGKAAVMAVGPLAVSLLRFTGASAALLLYLRLRGPWPRIERRDIPKIILLGFLVVPVNQGLFLFGLVHSTASHASLLYALTPVIVLVLARRMLGEGAVLSKLLGICVAFVGVAIILLEHGMAQEKRVLVGDLMILVAVFAFAFYTVYSKPLTVRYGAMPVTTWCIATGTLFCLPGFLIPGAIPPLATIQPEVWWSILYLAIGTSMIAYPLWMYALRHLDASKVAVTSNVQPILTGFFSWLLFHERFTPGFLIGAVLVLVGVTWVETRRVAGGRIAPAGTSSKGELVKSAVESGS